MGKRGGARSVPRRRLEARPGGRYDLRVVSATGRSRSPIAKSPDLAGRGTHLSAAVSRALHRRLVAFVVVDVSGGLIRGSRARATLGTFHGPSPPSPVYDRDSSDLLLPSRDENTRARPGAREPTARLRATLRGRDAHLERVCASPRRGFRYAGRRATADVRVAREIGPLALPETKTQRVRVRRDGPLSRGCSVRIRARTTRSRDLPRRLPRLSPLGIVDDDQCLMSGARRAACAPREPPRRGVVPEVRAGLLPHLRRGRCCRIHISYFRRGSRDDLTRERLVETVGCGRTRGSFGAPRATPSSRPTAGANRDRVVLSRRRCAT